MVSLRTAHLFQKVVLFANQNWAYVNFEIAALLELCNAPSFSRSIHNNYNSAVFSIFYSRSTHTQTDLTPFYHAKLRIQYFTKKL